MRVIWLPSARRQRESAIDYIAERDPQAAIGVLDRVIESAARLADHPYIGRPGLVPNTRELVVSPYVLVYDVSEDAARILAVYHHKQQRP